MKVETPQLRWHQIVNPQSQKDAGANGPILSCSLLTDDDGQGGVGVLATAGNTEVNLWRVGFTLDEARVSGGDNDGAPSSSGEIDVDAPTTTSATNTGGEGTGLRSRILVQPQTSNSKGVAVGAASAAAPSTPQTTARPSQNRLSEHTRIEHVATLSRGTNDRQINAVKFSPDGRRLLAAGDGGTVVVWSAPPSSVGDSAAGSGNGGACPTGSVKFWSSMTEEKDAAVKIIFNQSDDVMDVVWSSDSRRFAACSLDHTMTVWEMVENGEWKNVHRGLRDHTHYVQGVAYDPRGVYVATMGSDRMVKVHSRKGFKGAAMREGVARYEVEGGARGDDGGDGKNAILQSKVMPQLLSSSKFELQKAKTIKFLNAAKSNSSTAENDSAARDGNKSGKSERANTNATASSPIPPSNGSAAGGGGGHAKRPHLFVDELTLGSFFRRLAFTPDGAFLVAPAGLWHGMQSVTGGTSSQQQKPTSPTSVTAAADGGLSDSSFATYLFARHRFDRPYKVLAGLDKPSVVVRPNPVLFRLPKNDDGASGSVDPASGGGGGGGLPYRSIFAVLTTDSVLIYDTYSVRPLAMARGLHYAGLTDAAWSSDGRTLFVTSSDGYVSILSFASGELGEVYEEPKLKIVKRRVEGVVAGDGAGSGVESSSQVSESITATTVAAPAVTTLVPKKKAKEVGADSEADGEEKGKVTFATPIDDRSNQQAMTSAQQEQQPVINTLVPKKKKKKVAPTLVAVPSGTLPQDQTPAGSGVEKSVSDDGANVGTKRPPVVASHDAPVNILVPKKKKKVTTSNGLVATM